MPKTNKIVSKYGPNPDDRINRKKEDQIFDHKTEKAHDHLTCNITNMYSVLHDVLIACCVIPSGYYTTLLFGRMVIFGPMVFYLFGPPVFIYSVMQFWSSDPVSPNIKVLADWHPRLETLKSNVQRPTNLYSQDHSKPNIQVQFLTGIPQPDHLAPSLLFWIRT